MGFAINLLACLVSIFIGIYTYVRWKYQYWKNQGVPYIEPIFPYGNVGNPSSRQVTFGEVLQERYNYFKSQGHKYGGLYIFSNAIFLPIHLESIKAIMSTDFNNFMNHGAYYNEEADPLSAHLFNLEGQRWRKLRAKLTPTFTSGKMKTMFHILVSCSDQLLTAVSKSSRNEEVIDIKEVLGCFTTDVIGSCAFGIECNSFEDKESEFRKYGRELLLPMTKYESVKNGIGFSFPTLARFLGICSLKKKTTNFFFKAVKETVQFREKNNVQRNDFMQILINLKNHVDDTEAHDTKGTEKHNLTIEEIAAQAFVFFIAGFETSSTTMTFCLLELALNQEIQDKVRNEVLDDFTNNGGEFTYDSMMKTNYLSQVIDETLRKYPPVPFIPQICVEDYIIPGTNSTIKEGMRVLIPVLALHRDPEFFPDPETFDPERFNAINKPKIPPYSYLPFGEGPRNCIGSRFGLMQTKVGLSVLLKNFRFTINEKTNLPVKFNKNSFILLAKDGIWLNVEAID